MSLGSRMPESTAIRKFQRRFAGRVILPGDSEYDSARRIHNGAILRQPALIAMCTAADDVCRAVEFARENQLLVAVRSGGHSQAGHSVCDGGIVIDLSGMKQVSIDPACRLARAQTGLHAGDLDHAAQASGLATPVGQCPSVGLGGLTTGGGFGWLTGMHGLTCDNVVSAEVVTADGRKLCADQHENADLFWALRGGGGNFGVAVEFEYRLHPVSQVIGGMLFYPMSQSRAGLVFMREYLSRAPDELTASFGIRPADGNPVFAIALCFCGDPKNAQRILGPLQSFTTPSSGSIGPLPYLQMQKLMGEWPSGSPLHTRGGFLRELTDAAIDAIVESASRNTSPARLISLDHYHGAMCRVAQEATAFSVRENGFGFLVQSEWDKPEEASVQIAWIDATIAALSPFSSQTAYVANLGDERPDRIKRCYGPNYPRLAALKRKYDPDNFFRLNQNILPPN